MKKILHSFTLLLFACCLLLGSVQEARASHLLGGDMTYVSLGNNQYRVKFRLYRDCTGITPSAFTLSCSNNGCNAMASVTAPFVQQGLVEAGNPFCAAVSSGPCLGPTGLPNYDVYNYLATVTLPPGQWTLSTDQGSRPSLANIVAGNLYVQATLDNRNSSTGAAVANNSPQFDVQDIPIQYVCWNQPTTITYSATEADGDSLVYSLTAPLEACGTPVTYNAYPNQAGGVVILTPNATCPTCPLCVLQLPTITANYSPTLPIPVGYDETGSCPIKTGTPRFIFNQQARTISFTPNVYIPNSPANLGLNKYQIAVLITEYRRINGVRRVIGTVRREANLIVTDCGGNSTPNPVVVNPVTVNSGTVAVNTTDTTRLDVSSCSYSRVQLNFTDPDNIATPTRPAANPLQLLTVTLPADINTNPNLLDSGDVGSFVLSGNGTSNPKGTFFFQPSPSTVGRTIRLNIRIEDNACPIKGVQNRVVVIRIKKGNFATALATVGQTGLPNVTPVTLCSGSLALRGSVLRPDSVRRLAQNISVLQTYAFQWSLVSGNGFNTATAALQNITVTPTMTSRYRLQITPNSGFGPGCGDTTSILVRVAPPVVSRFTITDSISSRPVTNPNSPAGGLIPPITYKFSNTSTINGVLPTAYTSTVFRMDSIRWTYQRIKDGAGAPVTSTPKVFSRSYNPGNLVLSEGGTYIIALSSASTLIAPTVTNRGQCPVLIAQHIVIVPELKVPNIITPNNDNLNDVFVVPVSQRGGKLEIYNRWGRKVQEYANYQNTWGGGDQPSGVYYYYLTDPSGNKSKGWVEVNRGQ
ncbi:gliding motility-associated C-terminal domain-containing protein [Hymenobacter terricola]|uniref:gliding motility-associated C-terminal domain-containing protein n=1 Tax=Hymenobacter terricola TaxID=2819236 RepID=UPI001B307438|nr:gliding motility-associated C-terminal domain-containing protein [Hymenobacter terricola]